MSSSNDEPRILLTDEQLAELPPEVREVLALATNDYDAYDAAISELSRRPQAATMSPEAEARVEAAVEQQAEVEELTQSGSLFDTVVSRGAPSDEEVVRGLADDGVLAREPDGRVDQRIWKDLFGGSRKPFDKRTRVKDSGAHGTAYRYNHGKCRCDECKAEMARLKREQRRRKGDAS
jgi:hypothetical protein